MPRIRKKTSKRISTHQRARIKHKVAEGRKRNKKSAKKNPQWKSKKKKDPGIPNNFPYKDQILAEIAETRRQVEEAKQRRKEEKKASREGARVAANGVTDELEDLVSANRIRDVVPRETRENENEEVDVNGDEDMAVPKSSLTGKRGRSAADSTEPPPAKKVTFAVGTWNGRGRKSEPRCASKSASKKPTVAGTAKANAGTPKATVDAYDFDQFFKS